MLQVEGRPIPGVGGSNGQPLFFSAKVDSSEGRYWAVPSAAADVAFIDEWETNGKSGGSAWTVNRMTTHIGRSGCNRSRGWVMRSSHDAADALSQLYGET